MTANSDVMASISDQELELAFDLPAPFTNKFYVHLTDITGRITFAESSPTGIPTMRAAVCMSLTDLEALGHLITQVLAAQRANMAERSGKNAGQ